MTQRAPAGCMCPVAGPLAGLTAGELIAGSALRSNQQRRLQRLHPHRRRASGPGRVLRPLRHQPGDGTISRDGRRMDAAVGRGGARASPPDRFAGSVTDIGGGALAGVAVAVTGGPLPTARLSGHRPGRPLRLLQASRRRVPGAVHPPGFGATAAAPVLRRRDRRRRRPRVGADGRAAGAGRRRPRATPLPSIATSWRWRRNPLHVSPSSSTTTGGLEVDCGDGQPRGYRGHRGRADPERRHRRSRRLRGPGRHHPGRRRHGPAGPRPRRSRPAPSYAASDFHQG